MVQIGYTARGVNSVDYMTQMFQDPCAIINSELYRYEDPENVCTL